MSYQLGGYTVFMNRDAVQEIEGLTVEDLLKLSLTAGVGGGKPDAGEASQDLPGPAAGPDSAETA